MKFRCPKCRKKLRSDSTKAGKLVRCPRCSGTFRIPVLQAGQEARVGAAAPSQPGNGRSRSPILVATSAVVGVLAVSLVAAVLLWPRGNALREQGPEHEPVAPPDHGPPGDSEGSRTVPPDAGPSTNTAGLPAGPAVEAPRKAPSEPRDVDPQLPASGPAGSPDAPRARPPDAGPSTHPAGPAAGPAVDTPRKAPSEPREVHPPHVVSDTSLAPPHFGNVRRYHGGTVLGKIGGECGIPVYLYVEGGTLYIGAKRLGDRIQVSLGLCDLAGKRMFTEDEKKAAREKIVAKLRQQPACLFGADGASVGKPSSTTRIDSGITAAVIRHPVRLVTPWGEIDLVLPGEAPPPRDRKVEGDMRGETRVRRDPKRSPANGGQREAKPSADQEPSDTPTALDIVKVLTRRGFREKPLVGFARVFGANRAVLFYSYLHSDTGVELKMTRNELALLGLRGPGNEYDFSASQDPKDLHAFLGIVADLAPKLRSACTDCLSEYGQKEHRSERVVGTVRVLVDKDGIHLKSAGIDK